MKSIKTTDILESSSLKNKKDKAITLIALVITIIVLLILAGIAIVTLTGENGLLSKAQLAKEKTAEAENDEKDKLSSYENEIDNYQTWERTGGTVTISEEEYNQLKKDATTIQVTGNIPTKDNANNDWTKIADYPSGYNKTDLYIKSFICEKNGFSDISYFGCQFQLRNDGIYYWANDSGRWNVPITIFLGLK